MTQPTVSLQSVTAWGLKSEHYPSLELCKKLTEAGFPQTENEWKTWQDWLIKWILPAKIKKKWLWGLLTWRRCPSIAELLDELPKSIETEDLEYYLYIDVTNDKVYYTDDNCWSCESELLIEHFWEHLPNALAEMWLWLKENNLLPNK